MNLPFHFLYKIVLGSGSPRRKQLLHDAGFDFEIIKGDVDETFDISLKAQEIPLYLSKKKADFLFPLINKEAILITADTIVWINDYALNKPDNFSHACSMLQELSGNKHEVFTGVTITSAEKQISFAVKTTVYFNQLTQAEIEFYVNNYKPYDKAGAYGAQDWIGLIAVSKIEGSYFNVMGLPVNELYNELKKF